MKKLELVFIPAPGFGHLTSAIELAKLLLDRDDRLSITVLVILLPSVPAIGTYTQSLAASGSRITYINLPQAELSSLPVPSSSSPMSMEKMISIFIESHKSHVQQAITELLSDESVKLIGLVLDLFCTSMIDIANKFSVPSYIFFTSSAAFLGFMLHLPIRHNQIGAEFEPTDPDSIIPSCANPVPANVLPEVALNKEGGYISFLGHAMRFKETKGFIVNSFAELEPHAINSITPQPPVYPVGPLLDLRRRNHSTGSGKSADEIMSWLDNQPPSSVVFLCFGSLGSFNAPQLEHMANALERSGHRFLWAIRQPPPKDNFEMPSEYTNVDEVLPEGFWKRTKERGLVCGWAPQVEVLAHQAVGGFVSHSGWNSVLESLWYGVPIATWPMYAEQQWNAFVLVRELGLAVELTLDYRYNSSDVVMVDEIERVIMCLMDDKNPVRDRVKEMSEKSRKAVMEGGSSFVTLGQLIEDILGNKVEASI